MAVLERSFLATAIMETLDRRGPLPVGYLAKLHGRPVAQILFDLEKLKRDGLIKMDCQGEDCLVTLTQH